MQETLVQHAARLIQAGKLVAFPTETVYGLGANALDATAVARIYEVKQRPRTSPLIVHVSSIEMARSLVLSWPEEAETLARRYWPGPLTLVLPKQAQVPEVLTAGLNTVGIRMPAHPLALELIRAAGLPIAAPSANRFTELSPTTAGHVRASLGADVDCILDGGPTTVGIESTVLSLALDIPLLLRPGMITREEIEDLIGPVATVQEIAGAHPSPGMNAKHYSPRTPLFLVESGAAPPEGRGAFLYLTAPAGEKPVPMPDDAQEYASRLYDTLHALDRDGLDWIAVEVPPDRPAWAGIRDRLRRAAAGIVSAALA